MLHTTNLSWNCAWARAMSMSVRFSHQSIDRRYKWQYTHMNTLTSYIEQSAQLNAESTAKPLFTNRYLFVRDLCSINQSTKSRAINFDRNMMEQFCGRNKTTTTKFERIPWVFGFDSSGKLISPTTTTVIPSIHTRTQTTMKINFCRCENWSSIPQSKRAGPACSWSKKQSQPNEKVRTILGKTMHVVGCGYECVCLPLALSLSQLVSLCIRMDSYEYVSMFWQNGRECFCCVK